MVTKMKRKMAILAAALLLLVAGWGGVAKAGSGPPPPSGLLDHYKCYTAKGDDVQGSASLSDQFSSVSVKVQKPVLHCNPVDKNGGGIQNSTDHLVCYKIDPKDKVDESKDEPRVNNQFGSDQQLKVGRAKFLCVPSGKAPEA